MLGLRICATLMRCHVGAIICPVNSAQTVTCSQFIICLVNCTQAFTVLPLTVWLASLVAALSGRPGDPPLDPFLRQLVIGLHVRSPAARPFWVTCEHVETAFTHTARFARRLIWCCQ